MRHHTAGPEAVHNNKTNDMILRRLAQQAYERNHAREEFRAKFQEDNLTGIVDNTPEPKQEKWTDGFHFIDEAL